MEWDLKRIQNEINNFAQHTRETLGKDIHNYNSLLFIIYLYYTIAPIKSQQLFFTF